MGPIPSKPLRKLPQAAILFDFFHVVAAFNRVVAKIHNSEYRKAAKENKDVFKGAKYLLLKNRSHIRRKKQRQQLRELLEPNEVLSTVMILKDRLKHIWTYRSRAWTNKALAHWCVLARSLYHRALNSFANMLQLHRYGILHHCEYPVHAGRLEGANNKIKVLKCLL